MAEKGRAKIMGVRCRRFGDMWNWQLDGIAYCWCRFRHVFGWHRTGVCKRVGFSGTLEGAVGFTVGLHEGKGLAQRTVAMTQ